MGFHMGGYSRNCPVCGKEFFITPEWAFRANRENRRIYLCSYGCLNRYKAKKQEAKQEIEEGLTMTDAQKIKLQRWWMAELQIITRKVMKEEEARQAKARARMLTAFGNLDIERKEDIDDLYAYGVITERKRDKLLDMLEQGQQPGELYQAKIDLLQDAYREAKTIMQDLGQEV